MNSVTRIDNGLIWGPICIIDRKCLGLFLASPISIQKEENKQKEKSILEKKAEEECKKDRYYMIKTDKVLLSYLFLRSSGIEPEEQDWKSGMLPLHHER